MSDVDYSEEKIPGPHKMILRPALKGFVGQ